ncbi:glycosyl hydrolase family 28-related protein [Sphingomonas flavalba]|uniref:glycosyl hydrolase family 28-related protein n=1 Tax=Sphingomonas flavalba TaxID=2559804 RepID=UPI00109E31D2|nr:glycosyl hydrolase family 28-related protein [Sphingomonas flavalba]
MIRDSVTRRGALGGLVATSAVTAAPAATPGRDAAARPGNTRSIVSVTDFGLSGNGKTLDQRILQAVIDTMSANGGGSLHFPDGTYNLGGDTLVLRSGVSLIGNSGRTKLLYNGTGRAVMLDDRPRVYGDLRFENFIIDGSGTDALFCATVDASALGGVNIDVRNIKIKGKWVNGATFANLYNSSISRISTDGAIISNACHRIMATVNGMTFHDLYTGGSRGHKYSYYIDNSGQLGAPNNLPIGHDIALIGCVAQGGLYGFYIRSARSLSIIAPYTEEVANPVVVGEVGAPRTSNVIIDGGGLGGTDDPTRPYFAQRGPRIHVENAEHTVIRSLDCRQGCRLVALAFKGGGGTGARGWASIGKDGRVSHAVVTFPGSGYVRAPIVTERTTGSTYTAILDDSRQVIGVTVNAVGQTKLATAYPAIVTYGNQVQGLIIDAPYARLLDVDGRQCTDTMIPAIARRASTKDSSGGLLVTGDYLGMKTFEVVDIRKVAGTGHRHFVSWRDSDGIEKGWVYEVPVVAAP